MSRANEDRRELWGSSVADTFGFQKALKSAAVAHDAKLHPMLMQLQARLVAMKVAQPTQALGEVQTLLRGEVHDVLLDILLDEDYYDAQSPACDGTSNRAVGPFSSKKARIQLSYTSTDSVICCGMFEAVFCFLEPIQKLHSVDRYYEKEDITGLPCSLGSQARRPLRTSSLCWVQQ